ncbi:MAG: aldo/keto reductase [Planctomycetota bacterium]
MNPISRRSFVTGALGAAALLGGCRAPARPSRRVAADRVALGTSGVRVPRVALGSGTRGWQRVSDQTKLGKESYARLVRHGVERGAAFLDAADLYGSHEYVRHALRSEKIPRDRVVILSKIWFTEAPGMTPTTTAKPEVERFCRELGVDMIDIVLIHCTQDPEWPVQLARMRDELSELKERGIVRAVGCSCHTHAALRAACEHPWTDVVLARINPRHAAMDDDATVEETVALLRTAKARGKGVLGMKLFGCGALTDPAARAESLRFSFGSDLIDAGTIGFLAPAEIDDAMDAIDGVLA